MYSFSNRVRYSEVNSEKGTDVTVIIGLSAGLLYV